MDVMAKSYDEILPDGLWQAYLAASRSDDTARADELRDAIRATLTADEIEAAGGSMWGAIFRRRTAHMTPEQIEREVDGHDPDAVLED